MRQHRAYQTPPSELTDAEVIRLYLQSQSQRYFSMIYRKYAGKVYGKCLSILRNDEQAQDAMQDIFMRILLNLASFNEKSSFSTWLYSVTYNHCIDVIRKRKKEQSLFSDDEVERAPDVAEEDVPDEYLLAMDVKHLQTVLEALDEDDRLILLMKYQDDMSIKDIADALRKTESAIKMKIKRAKYKAQERYKILQAKNL